MKKRNKDQIIKELVKEGLSFSEFSLVHEGEYTVADADWNYKDIPHLHYIHQLVEAAPTIIADDLITSINVQKILGIKIPLCVVNYQSGHNEQTYYTTCLFFALVIQTRYEELGPCKTRVITTYHIGTPKLLKWTVPFIKFLIKRNYKDLMSGDIPMRDRRGQLRKWGYSFYKPSQYYSFPFTAEIMRNNVIPPMLNPEQATKMTMTLSDILPRDGEYFAGRNDHWGVRLIRKNNQISIFRRLCPHEGASLDHSPCHNMQLKCPWHGRMHAPLATFSLDDPATQEAVAGDLHFMFVNNSLTIVKQSTAYKEIKEIKQIS